MRYLITILSLTLLFLACNPITERMSTYAVHGIDVSHHQSFINWDEVAQENLHFAFVKASEGQNFQDSLYCYNWDEINRVQLKRGAYHFFRPNVSPDLQARNFMDLVELRQGDLPPVLDVEVLDNVSKKDLVKNMKLWLEMVEQHFGVRPIIYTNLKFYYLYIASDFKDYPIWIARYNSRNVPFLVNQDNWSFWQYGNRGRINGIKGNVDLNVFHGTSEELEEMGYVPPILYSELQLQ